MWIEGHGGCVPSHSTEINFHLHAAAYVIGQCMGWDGCSHERILSLSYGFMSYGFNLRKRRGGQFFMVSGPFFAAVLLLTQFCMASAAV